MGNVEINSRIKKKKRENEILFNYARMNQLISLLNKHPDGSDKHFPFSSKFKPQHDQTTTTFCEYQRRTGQLSRSNYTTVKSN